jgi:hypothetical protein
MRSSLPRSSNRPKLTLRENGVRTTRERKLAKLLVLPASMATRKPRDNVIHVQTYGFSLQETSVQRTHRTAR